MKSETKPMHTPTPWKTMRLNPWIFSGPEGEEKTVCQIEDIHSEEGKADAAFIVRAVNVHEDLVRELTDAIIDLQAVYDWAKQQNKAFVVTIGMWSRLSAMKEAIAKAEGK